MGNAVQCCFERYEKKYMLTPDQYQRVLWGLRPFVRADRYSNYAISSLYYDTEDFRLIRTSLEKPVYKEKLRMRAYGVPGDHDRVFVELKKKYQGVVYKRRVALEAAEAVRFVDGGIPPMDAAQGQICREIEFFLDSYHPRARVFLAYDREAWQGIENPDLRVTFDTNLRWRDTALDLRAGGYGSPILPPDHILMEVKIPGAAPVWLARLFSDLEIFPTSFSKYGTWYKQTVLGQDLFFGQAAAA